MSLIILIADDDLGTRLFLNEYLEISGYSVITAENGQVALNLVEEYHPHLLITDIMMPQMDGYELVQQVRKRPEFRLLPVIFLTECASTEERIRGYHLGCDLYLPKPFEMEELGAMIRNLLERSQMIQSEWRTLVQAIAVPDQKITVSKTSAMAPATFWLKLTNREREVLNLLSTGLSNADIGNQMHLSSRTVEKYVSSLLRKTVTNNRAELVRFALDNHLVN